MNSAADLKSLIYDWNHVAGAPPLAQAKIHDETLRDGIQSPSVRDPSIEQKVEVLHHLEALGVDSVNVGLPGAGRRAAEHAERLCREIADQRMRIRPACAARTVRADLAPIVELSQRAGLQVEALTFVGSSAMRWLAEDWSLALIQQRTEDAVGFAVAEGLPTTYVTEDTTRSGPEVLGPLFQAAIGAGATRLCLCDTVGHATPDGVKALVAFARQTIAETGAAIELDWHGHNDRGLALENALWAVDQGVDRVHGCVLGIGERVGNTPLDLLLINMRLLGLREREDLRPLVELCRLVAEATDTPIPARYPVVGRDAFRTSTGVHAAAIIKAGEKGLRELCDTVYSGVPASLVGRSQEICIGPMSGASNVTHWLAEHGIEAQQALVSAILAQAKAGDRVLAEPEILEIVRAHTVPETTAGA